MTCREVVGDYQFGFEVVGESHHQPILEKIVGARTPKGAHFSCEALLRPEPTNPYDPYAVEVLIDRQQVGYIPRNQSQEMCTLIDSSGVTEATCGARIVGGWDRGQGDTGFFGVRLDIVRPFGFASVAPQRSKMQKFGDEAFEIMMKVLWAVVLLGMAFAAFRFF